MKRTFNICLVLSCALIGIFLTQGFSRATGNSLASVTFNKDVAPIIQKNCQVCHRPGEIAPMAFMNYKEVRPWARSIREKVVTRAMPPWFADPQYGEFS